MRRDGWQGVACPIVVSNRGNGLPGPRGAKGVPRCGRGVGTDAEDPAPHRRVTAKQRSRVKDSDSPNVTNRMPLQRARPDLWEPQGAIPGATRPLASRPPAQRDQAPAPLLRGARLREILRGNPREAERRMAEILQSHLSHPVLTFYRPHHWGHSWLVALTGAIAPVPRIPA